MCCASMSRQSIVLRRLYGDRNKQVLMCCSEVMKYIRHEEKNSCAHVLKMTFTRYVYNESCVLYTCWHVGRQSLRHAKKISCAYVLTIIFTRCVYNQSCVLYNCWHVGRQSLHHVQCICWNFLGLWLLKHSEFFRSLTDNDIQTFLEGEENQKEKSWGKTKTTATYKSRRWSRFGGNTKRASSGPLLKILHKMQDFLVLLVVVLQLMILYFLMEINRAVRHRATADKACSKTGVHKKCRREEEERTKTIAFR